MIMKRKLPQEGSPQKKFKKKNVNQTQVKEENISYENIEINNESGIKEIKNESGIKEIKNESGIKEIKNESGIKEIKNESAVKKQVFEKPDWRKMKSEKKILKDVRKKKHNSLYNTYKDVKKLWEQMRRSDCTNKEQLADRIYEQLKGNVVTVVRSHDMARIIQWALKFGSADLKNKIALELLEDIVRLTGSKYTIHVVKSLISNGSNDIKCKVLQKYHGNVVNLLCKKVSASLMEDLYTKMSNPRERFNLRKELYGSIFDSTFHSNSTILTSFSGSPEEKAAIINNTANILKKLVEKEHCLKLSIIHSVIYDYLCFCESSEKLEFIESIKGFLLSFLTSRDGAKVASLILWESSKKDKKGFVKALKNDVLKLAMNEHSSLFLLSLFDSVDDTVLTKKILIPELLANLEKLASNDHGRKVIVYLISHRNPAFFHPSDIEWLKQSESSSTVKKESLIRTEELKEAVLEPLLQKIVSNIKFWLESGKIGLLTLTALKVSSGETLRNAYNHIVDFIINDSDGENSIIEHAGMHMIIKKIISHDTNISTSSDTFSEILVKKLNSNIIKKWITINRGCFLLVFILKTDISDVCDTLKKMIVKENKLLKKETTAGAEVLKTLI